MNKKIIVIGERSNLSNEINKFIKDTILIPTIKIERLEKILSKNEKYTIIYNTSCKSTLINELIDPKLFSYYSFDHLSEFIKICLRYQSRINQIIYTSSSSVYGNNKFAKEESNCNITNIYASLKFSSELLLKKYILPSKIKLVITRIFNMYGGNDQFSIVSKILNALKTNETLKISNGGESIRDFINIQDVVEIYKILILKEFSGLINISTGRGYSIKELIEIAELIFDKKLNIETKKVKEIEISIGSNIKLNKISNINNRFITIPDYYKKVFNTLK